MALGAEGAGGGVVADPSCGVEVASCARGSAFAVVAGLDDPVGEAVLVDHGRGFGRLTLVGSGEPGMLNLVGRFGGGIGFGGIRFIHLPIARLVRPPRG